jgi:hypothetical protein
MADQDGTLTLAVTDVYQQNIQEKVTVLLKNQALEDNRFYQNQDASQGAVQLDKLFRAPQGLYLIEVDAPSYQSVAQFITIPAGGGAGLNIWLPVNPARVTSLTRPDAADLQPDLLKLLNEANIPSFPGAKGAQLYSALDDLSCAALLNLVAKARNTVLSGGKPALSYLGTLVELHQDRLFASITPELPAVCARSGNLHAVPDDLHQPAPGFQHAGSYKTFDHYGNLQLTFSNKANTNEWMLDMDIDDAQGLEHVFQVVRNAVTGEPTHPYNIHEILVRFQTLDPGYMLNVGETFQAKAAGAGN